MKPGKLIHFMQGRSGLKEAALVNPYFGYFLLLITPVVAVIGIGITISYFIEYYGVDGYWLYPVSSGICVAILLLCYHGRKKESLVAFFELVAYFSLVGYVVFLQIVMGRPSGTAVFIVPYIFIPFFLTKAFLAVRVLLSVGCALLYVAMANYVQMHEPLLPLSDVYNNMNRTGVAIGMPVFNLVLIGFLGLKYKATIAGYLQSLSYKGVGAQYQSKEDKARVLFNVILGVWIASLFLVLLGESVIYHILLEDNFSKYRWHALVALPTILAFVFSILLLRIHQRLTAAAKLGIIVAIIVMHTAFWTVGFGKPTNVHYFLCPTAFIPLLFLQVLSKRAVILLMLLPVSVLVYVAAVYQGGPVLFELPPGMLKFVETYSLYNVFLVSAAIVYYFARENLVAEGNLHAAQKQTQSLLLNILPENVAAELKQQGKYEPRRYQSASVMLTDFVGFTKISERMTSEELIGQLDECFHFFDEICDLHRLEKIKTIGDGYVFAGGLPSRNNTHAIDCVLAAIAIQEYMKANKVVKKEQGVPYWEVRLGIHTGPLVAGVVGSMKFAYDIFGNTVNTAFSLESSGQSGKINISGATYEEVKHLFNCRARGEVPVADDKKIRMYFIEGIKAQFSEGGEGIVPNAVFAEEYRWVKEKSIFK